MTFRWKTDGYVRNCTYTHRWTRIEGIPTLLTHLRCQASAVTLEGLQSTGMQPLACSNILFPTRFCESHVKPKPVTQA